MLHSALHAAHLILKLPPRVLERIVDRESQVGVPPVRWRRAFNIHFAALRQRETNMDLIQRATAVTMAGRIHDDPARRHATAALLEFSHMLLDSVPDCRGFGHAVKFDLGPRLHGVSPI
jgi:hypothetical protein